MVISGQFYISALGGSGCSGRLFNGGKGRHIIGSLRHQGVQTGREFCAAFKQGMVVGVCQITVDRSSFLIAFQDLFRIFRVIFQRIDQKRRHSLDVSGVRCFLRLILAGKCKKKDQCDDSHQNESEEPLQRRESVLSMGILQSIASTVNRLNGTAAL